ncbi:Rieske (2Fe-2S) protein [Actinomadura kijaniata]|uniref:Rieske (2Fe-2S) protein n=1 Tax=Actinomadura kijaniata TaxID=46161 RepID=UPI000A044561|nr:Rieske (2Fe-2S) protein [Actinomadura kijaniata]
MAQDPAVEPDGATPRGEGAARDATRRGVLLGAGIVGAATLAAACGGSGDDVGQGGQNGGQTSGKAGDQTGSGAGDGSGGGEGLGAASAIPVGGGKVFKDKKIVVTQPAQGQFKAFSATCTHRGCPVGDVSGGTINCPCHGSKFKITDGSVAQGPADKPLEEKQISVEGDRIRLG